MSERTVADVEEELLGVLRDYREITMKHLKLVDKYYDLDSLNEHLEIELKQAKGELV